MVEILSRRYYPSPHVFADVAPSNARKHMYVKGKSPRAVQALLGLSKTVLRLSYKTQYYKPARIYYWILPVKLHTNFIPPNFFKELKKIILLVGNHMMSANL